MTRLYQIKIGPEPGRVWEAFTVLAKDFSHAAAKAERHRVQYVNPMLILSIVHTGDIRP